MPNINNFSNTAGVGSRLSDNNTAGLGNRFDQIMSNGSIGIGSGGVGSSSVNPSNHWSWEPPQTYDHPIQGRMIMVDYQASEYIMSTMDDAAAKYRIKEEIAFALAKKMIEENVIEFTQIPDHHSGHTTIKARCFLVTEDRVRLLRTLYKYK